MSTSVTAAVSPFSAAHRLYVKSLYKRVLNNSLNWTIRRDLWRPRALEIRAEFERHRHVTDPRALVALFEQVEAFLEDHAHPDPYIPSAFPGGTKWERNIPPRMGPIYDHHHVESEEGSIAVKE